MLNNRVRTLIKVGALVLETVHPEFFLPARSVVIVLVDSLGISIGPISFKVVSAKHFKHNGEQEHKPL